ncbi:hypothetical protein QE370_002061 [Aeromicrobium sp. SORGH_AS981]|nr:hypothetical protein [Aeromicrobium sp. SORGH_AS_0981]
MGRAPPPDVARRQHGTPHARGRRPPCPRCAARRRRRLRHGRPRASAGPHGPCARPTGRRRCPRHGRRARRPAAPRCSGGQGRHRIDEPRWSRGHGLRDRRPLHRPRRRDDPARRHAGRQDAVPHRARRRRHRRHDAGVRRGGARPRRGAGHGHGRAVHLPPPRRTGRQRPVDRRGRALRHRRRRPRADVGLHVAEAARRRRHGRRPLGHRPAGAAARRRGLQRPGGAVRGLVEGALAHPAVRGMVVGRSLLFPPDGDVEAAVDATVAML